MIIYMLEKLSEHFTLKEMTRSVTAARHHIDNTPDANAKENLRYLCNHVLEPLREEYGAPTIINSGFRCVAVNQLVGGVKNSQHLKGEAADIHLPSIAAGQQMFRILKQQRNFDQLIWEHTATAPFTGSTSAASDRQIGCRCLHFRKDSFRKCRSKKQEAR